MITAVITLGAVAILFSEHGIPLSVLIFVGFVLGMEYWSRKRPSAASCSPSAATTRRPDGPASRSTGSKSSPSRSPARWPPSAASSPPPPVRRQPELGRQRNAAARDRRPRDRRHQPLRRPRHGLDRLLGTLVIGSMSNGMDLLSHASPIKYVVTGGVLLLAVLVDAVAERQRQTHSRA